MIKKQNRWWLCTWLIEEDDPQTPSQPPQPQTEIVSSAVNIQLCSGRKPTPTRIRIFNTDEEKERLLKPGERYFQLPVSFFFSLSVFFFFWVSQKTQKNTNFYNFSLLNQIFDKKNKRYHSRIRLIFMTGKQSSNIFLAYVMLSIEFPNFQLVKGNEQKKKRFWFVGEKKNLRKWRN